MSLNKPQVTKYTELWIRRRIATYATMFSRVGKFSFFKKRARETTALHEHADSDIKITKVSHSIMRSCLWSAPYVLNLWFNGPLRTLASFTPDEHSYLLPFASILSHSSLVNHFRHLPAISMWAFPLYFCLLSYFPNFIAILVWPIPVTCPNHSSILLLIGLSSTLSSVQVSVKLTLCLAN
jgi:hypothetical protein